MATKVIMPQLGESVVEGTVTRWLKQEGEAVDEFAALLEVNTDKVDTEVPSPAAGTLLRIVVPEGTTVTAGTVLAWIGQPDETLPVGEGGNGKKATAEMAAGRSAAAAMESHPPLAGRDRDLGFISPVVAKLAREHHIDLARVKGTGAGGRITKKDVLAFVESSGGVEPTQAPVYEPAAWETPGEGDLFRPTELVFGPGELEQEREAPPLEEPAAGVAPQGKRDARATPSPSPLPGGEGKDTTTVTPLPTGTTQVQSAQGDQVIPLNPIRKAVAEHMVMSKHTSPHVTTVMEADLSKVVAHREANRAAFSQKGINLTYTAYFVTASAAALRLFPLVNSSWSDQGVLMHASINIGMATSLGEDGLIVPVVKHADELSLAGVARAVNDLAERARSRRLQPEEVKGGTFTITNHGISGSLFATPIINQPQCGILGVGAIQKRVVVIQDAIAIRPMVYLSLTFDHRILDGASADHFLAKIVEGLQNWV